MNVDEMIDLGIGHAEDCRLPLAQMQKAAAHRLSLSDGSFLQYGPEEGSLSFRTQLASFLTRQYGLDTPATNLLITAGASHGLDLILNRLSRPGDIVFVEDPTCFFALKLFKDRKLRVVPIPTDRDGLSVQALERQLKNQKPNFLYTIPVFQNPTGAVLPDDRRRRLIELAKEYDFLIIADEVYQLLGDRGNIPLPLAAFEESRVLSLGSFSKILGPGLRLGWIQCASNYLQELKTCGVLQSGGGGSPFTAAIVESAIELGLQDEYLSTRRTLFDARRTYMTDLLTKILPHEVTFVPPPGGFFIWLKLPCGIDSSILSARAAAMNINFKPGRIFSCQENFENYLRLCFTFYSEDKLRDACEKLAGLLSSQIESVKSIHNSSSAWLSNRALQAEANPFERPGKSFFHYAWTQRNQYETPETALESPLLHLHQTSDVNNIEPEQIVDARRVLQLNRKIMASTRESAEARPAGENIEDTDHLMVLLPNEVRRLQRRIVERFLEGRRKYFGEEQCSPLEGAAQMAEEGRNIFLVVKFMDEGPHIRATIQSLLNQKQVDMTRVVIVAADNNSTDGSGEIIKEMIAANRSAARLIYTNQVTPGGGNAARFGVDRSIATIYQMCLHDDNWDRLQRAVIAVSDGDTVYHHEVLAENLRILAHDPTVDGVMPFLAYKLTAALRLFHNYIRSFPEDLCSHVDPGKVMRVPVDLSTVDAHDMVARKHRKRVNERWMELEITGSARVRVELGNQDARGRRFAVLQDANGNLAYLLEDRTLVLAEAPVSGFDALLVFLENGCLQNDEKWRWHTLIGHDLFLAWAFTGMGLPEEMVYPDTSDALKMFRAWSFAIGGQHQLSRPDLKIVTGTDYQSGRVLQAVGCAIRLGPAHAYAETETDRLTKMIRNFAHQYSVFYGETRSSAIERASGLYLHMTRIQSDVEGEIRQYPDDFFEQIAFPERILLPLRWMFQNALRFYAHFEEEAQQTVRERFLDIVFPPLVAKEVEVQWFKSNAEKIRRAEYSKSQDIAEQIAESIIAQNYPAIMTFYANTLRAFFHAHRAPYHCYEWLLIGLESSRNAISEKRPRVHPSVVWQGNEFHIDGKRGQVVRMRTKGN